MDWLLPQKELSGLRYLKGAGIGGEEVQAQGAMGALRYKHRTQGHQTMEILTNHDGVSALSNARRK